MKNSFFYQMLTSLLIGSLCFTVTSCKDDDNENESNNGSEQAEGVMDDAGRFWSVVSNLVDPFNVTDDYQNQTYEPTIGEPLDGNQTVRVVNATDIDVASQMFAAMTGAPVDASTSSYTFQDNAIGTMTYTKATDGKSLATVDVSIKQIPGLQRIVYKTPEQMGNNASTGTPYYSFGDLISYQNSDNATEHWVCVHPAFTPQGQSDTYWVTVSPLPRKNIATYTASNGFVYNLPTKIGKNEHLMQNFAEFLYALGHGDEWEANTKKDGCPKPFGDIKKEKVMYINQYFWKRVRNAWNDSYRYRKFFVNLRNLEIITDALKDEDGLSLLNNGYSWHWSFSNKCTLYESTYYVKENETGGNLNAHHKVSRTVTKNVINPKIELSFKNHENSFFMYKDFFGDSGLRLVFRFATGKQLFGKNPDIYQSMSSNSKIKDVYVYTQLYKVPVGAKEQMKVLSEDDVKEL